MLVDDEITQDILTFDRSGRPIYADKLPVFIGFFYGSSVALCATVFILDECALGRLLRTLLLGILKNVQILRYISLKLITEKSEVSPMDGLTIPRSELTSLLSLT